MTNQQLFQSILRFVNTHHGMQFNPFSRLDARQARDLRNNDFFRQWLWRAGVPPFQQMRWWADAGWQPTHPGEGVPGYRPPPPGPPFKR